MLVTLAMATSLILGTTGKVEAHSVLYGTATSKLCKEWSEKSTKNFSNDKIDQATGRPLISVHYHCVVVPLDDLAKWGAESYEEVEAKTYPN